MPPPAASSGPSRPSNYINGTPAVVGDQIVFGGCDGKVHVLSAQDGKEIREIDAEAYVAGGVAVTSGRAYLSQFGGKVHRLRPGLGRLPSGSSPTPRPSTTRRRPSGRRRSSSAAATSPSTAWRATPANSAGRSRRSPTSTPAPPSPATRSSSGPRTAACTSWPWPPARSCGRTTSGSRSRHRRRSPRAWSSSAAKTEPCTPSAGDRHLAAGLARRVLFQAKTST